MTCHKGTVSRDLFVIYLLSRQSSTSHTYLLVATIKGAVAGCSLPTVPSSLITWYSNTSPESPLMSPTTGAVARCSTPYLATPTPHLNRLWCPLPQELLQGVQLLTLLLQHLTWIAFVVTYHRSCCRVSSISLPCYSNTSPESPLLPPTTGAVAGCPPSPAAPSAVHRWTFWKIKDKPNDIGGRSANKFR